LIDFFDLSDNIAALEKHFCICSFAHTLQEKHVKLFLYQDGSVLDSDMFDMWGDKGTYSKAFSIHFG
jgi:hypothetical protein